MLRKEKLKQEAANAINWIKEYVKKAGAKGIVVGNSGGKDSSTVIAMATKAIRKRKCNSSINAMFFKHKRPRRCRTCFQNIWCKITNNRFKQNLSRNGDANKSTTRL